MSTTSLHFCFSSFTSSFFFFEYCWLLFMVQFFNKQTRWKHPHRHKDKHRGKVNRSAQMINGQKKKICLRKVNHTHTTFFFSFLFFFLSALWRECVAACRLGGNLSLTAWLLRWNACLCVCLRLWVYVSLSFTCAGVTNFGEDEHGATCWFHACVCVCVCVWRFFILQPSLSPTSFAVARAMNLESKYTRLRKSGHSEDHTRVNQPLLPLAI